jgi:Zn-dependent proteases
MRGIDFTQLLARVIVLITSIPVHESAHGLVAYWLGDPTARRAGRITLNPLRHFDFIGSAVLLIGGIGWAKPVPIDARYFRKPKRDMALSALAGPVSNIIMATLAIIILKAILLFFYSGGVVMDFIVELFIFMVLTNIALAIFNMLPVPPFDGSRIFLTFLPTKWYFTIMRYEKYIYLGVFLLLFLGVLSAPLNFLNSKVLILLDKATWFLGRVT